jgi:flagellar biosynthesis/type III secretory pathway protein FliH
MPHSGFTPLETFLRPPHAATPEQEPAPALPASGSVPVECVEALSAARRFYAGLSDALDVAVSQCLQRIARDVLARELQLAQPDVAAIVGAALDAFADENILSIRANPSDLDLLRSFGLELIADEELSRGDIKLMLRSGTIDLTLTARLDRALSLWNA